MALTIRAFQRNYLRFHDIIKPVRWNSCKNYSRILACGNSYQNTYIPRYLVTINEIGFTSKRSRCLTTERTNKEDLKKSYEEREEPSPKKLGLLQRFKQMYRDYWYVLVPVHLATSAMWLGTFYYTVSSGVDVLGLLESYGVSDALLKPLRESSAGYYALTFALYKLASPLRYAATVGGTTLAINRLQAYGWIKPVPSRERMKEMLQEKKDNIQDRFNESKQHYQTQMQTKRSQLMDEIKRYKTEMKTMKGKLKKSNEGKE